MSSKINANTTTGLVSSADLSGVIEFQSNGTSTMTIDSTGQVGIGTTSPQRKLDLRATSSCEQIIGISSAATDGKLWDLLVDGGSSGSTKSNFTIRPLTDSYNDVNIGLQINGTSGVVSTRTANAISPASVPTGSVIQTKWTNLGNGNFQTTAASIQNTGFTTSITPKLSTSKILHIVTIGTYFICDGNLQISNGTTSSPNLSDSFRDVSTTNYIYDMPPVTFTWLDSPATTSPITYTIWAYASGCGRTCYIGSPGDYVSSWTTMEIAA